MEIHRIYKNQHTCSFLLCSKLALDSKQKGSLTSPFISSQLMNQEMDKASKWFCTA